MIVANLISELQNSGTYIINWIKIKYINVDNKSDRNQLRIINLSKLKFSFWTNKVEEQTFWITITYLEIAIFDLKSAFEPNIFLSNFVAFFQFSVRPVHRGAFCQSLFRWIYYCHSSKSTGKKTGEMHLCAMADMLSISFRACWGMGLAND